MKWLTLPNFLLIQFCYAHYSNVDYYSLKSICSDQEPKNCTAAGPLCETCRTLVYCIQVGPDQYEKANTQICADDEKCSQQQCTTNPDPICDGTACMKFPCTRVGIFPDPFFCDKYVMCVDQTPSRIEPYTIECESGWGYDIAKQTCSIDLPNGQCNTSENNYPVPLCTQTGQNGALPENPSMFYMCEAYDNYEKKLYPKLYLCDNGWIYEDYECKDPNVDEK